MTAACVKNLLSLSLKPVPPQEWMRARAMTEAADKESAEAEIFGKKATRELAASEKAQLAVDKAQEKHREVHTFNMQA